MNRRLNKFLFEPLSFVDDMVQGDNCQKRAILKRRSDPLFGLWWID